MVGAVLAIAITFAAIGFTSRDGTAEVSFVTRPFEARIYLDGKLAIDPSGAAYTTPCTIPNLPRRPHHVVFKLTGAADMDRGIVDFNSTHEVTADW